MLLRAIAALLAAYALTTYLVGTEFGGARLVASHTYRWTESSHLLLVDRGDDRVLECSIAPEDGKRRAFRESSVGDRTNLITYREILVRRWFTGPATVRCDAAAVFSGAPALAVSSPCIFLVTAFGFLFAGIWIETGLNPGRLLAMARYSGP